MTYEEVIDGYIEESKKSFNRGCYYQWQRDRCALIRRVFDSFAGNGNNPEKIARILFKCDNAFSNYFEGLSATTRLWFFPDVAEIRDSLCTSLQES